MPASDFLQERLRVLQATDAQSFRPVHAKGRVGIRSQPPVPHSDCPRSLVSLFPGLDQGLCILDQPLPVFRLQGPDEIPVFRSIEDTGRLGFLPRVNFIHVGERPSVIALRVEWQTSEIKRLEVFQRVPAPGIPEIERLGNQRAAEDNRGAIRAGSRLGSG